MTTQSPTWDRDKISGGGVTVLRSAVVGIRVSQSQPPPLALRYFAAASFLGAAGAAASAIATASASGSAWLVLPLCLSGFALLDLAGVKRVWTVELLTASGPIAIYWSDSREPADSVASAISREFIGW